MTGIGYIEIDTMEATTQLRQVTVAEDNTYITH